MRSASPRETLNNLYAVLGDRWLASPHALDLAERKIIQLNRAAQIGLSTPSTLLSNDPGQTLKFRKGVASTGCAVKPLRIDGVTHGDYFWFPLTTLWTHQDPPADAITYAPSVLQEYIAKALELRCFVIGTEVYAASIDSQSVPSAVHDVRGANIPGRERTIFYSPFDLPADVAARLIDLVRSFNIHSASLDMIMMPSGKFVFLDLNPNGQWLWLEHDAKLPLTSAVARYLCSGLGSCRGGELSTPSPNLFR